MELPRGDVVYLRQRGERGQQDVANLIALHYRVLSRYLQWGSKRAFSLCTSPGLSASPGPSRTPGPRSSWCEGLWPRAHGRLLSNTCATPQASPGAPPPSTPLLPGVYLFSPLILPGPLVPIPAVPCHTPGITPSQEVFQSAPPPVPTSQGSAGAPGGDPASQSPGSSKTGGPGPRVPDLGLLRSIQETYELQWKQQHFNFH